MKKITILLKSFIIYSKLMHYQQKMLVIFEKTHIIFSLNTDNKFLHLISKYDRLFRN